MNETASFIVYDHDGERWMFIYDDPAAVLAEIGRYAADPELSLTWSDAAKLSLRVKQVQEEGV